MLQSQSQQKSHASGEIPMVKAWFEQLPLAERVLCVTTIDANITQSIKNMVY